MISSPCRLSKSHEWAGLGDVHIPTRFLLAASSIEQLRTPVWAPALRGLCEDVLYSPTPHHLPDVEEVQGWVSAQQGSKRRLSWAARGTWLAGRAGLTEQMLGSLGRANSEEPCRCLFPTADLPWLQREGSCFARHWNPCTPPPACLFILRLPA